MNKLTFLIALFLNLGIWGCDDKEREDTKPCTNYTEQEKTKKYEWFISSFGDEEGAGIIKQAQHFKVSKIDREEGTYYYQPQDGFIGADSVKIEVSEGSHVGGSDRGRITRYKIKFEITECGMKASKTKITE